MLDSRLHPVPVGVAGELYLAGDQLARGYVSVVRICRRIGSLPIRMAAWVRGCIALGTMWCRWNRFGGAGVHVGRTDFQVKFRGFSGSSWGRSSRRWLLPISVGVRLWSSVARGRVDQDR